jgi:hypothetical protein
VRSNALAHYAHLKTSRELGEVEDHRMYVGPAVRLDALFLPKCGLLPDFKFTGHRGGSSPRSTRLRAGQDALLRIIEDPSHARLAQTVQRGSPKARPIKLLYSKPRPASSFSIPGLHHSLFKSCTPPQFLAVLIHPACILIFNTRPASLFVKRAPHTSIFWHISTPGLHPHFQYPAFILIFITWPTSSLNFQTWVASLLRFASSLFQELATLY